MLPLIVPVTCRATSGAQSALASGSIVPHQNRTAAKATAKTPDACNHCRVNEATATKQPPPKKAAQTKYLIVSGTGNRYQSANVAHNAASMTTRAKVAEKTNLEKFLNNLLPVLMLFSAA